MTTIMKIIKKNEYDNKHKNKYESKNKNGCNKYSNNLKPQ
jgi:hypothetical protein